MSPRPTMSFTPLAAGLVVALCSLPLDARPLHPLAAVHAAAFAFHAVPTRGTNVPVTSCLDDNSGGTLREALFVAGEGDTLDMSALTCSTITLAQGQLWTATDVTLLGPSDHELTIDAASASRAIYHYGAGTLGVSHLGLRNGRLLGTQGYGACIFSSGSVEVDHAHIADCINAAASGSGGAVFAFDAVTISDSAITASDGHYGGGAVLAGNGPLTIERSTISGNTATHAGGLYANAGFMTIVDSTIAGNTATVSAGGGIRAYHGLSIIDSTISGNTAVSAGGGVQFGNTADIRNSTIAFNSAGVGGGLSGFAGSTLAMTSSIVGLNTGLPGNADVANVAHVTGSHNLVMSTDASVPPDTLTDDPGIDPLADNGGPTQTHALLPDSIAIDAGDNPGALPNDQRGLPRTSGNATDIGAYERQPDLIFADGFDAPGT